MAGQKSRCPGAVARYLDTLLRFNGLREFRPARNSGNPAAFWQQMSRLILLSNRAPSKHSADSGGLVVALRDLIESRKGIWVGAAPKPVRTPADSLRFVSHGQFDVGLFDLTRAEHNEYYLGYSNSTLWPVFHGRVDLAVFDSAFYRTYRKVARRIARQLHEIIQPDDCIWVHDYHMIPVAHELRRLGSENPIGFFLHIPAPSAQVFATIPEHAELAGLLTDYDLVGVQTTQHVSNVIDIFRRSVRGEMLRDGRLSINGRSLDVRSFPVSIDPEEFQETSLRSAATLERQSKARIIGVDRLDYSKGLPERLNGFRRFLELYPKHHGKVYLLQIAPPTREGVQAYVNIRNELELLSGKINGQYADFDWIPVHYIHRNVPRDRLAGLLRLSRVGLVTPLADGMNLVAKEYVAAQDAEDPGVLILSKFAGAAEEMGEALIVNPHDPEEVAHAINRAIVMPREERVERHRALMGYLSTHTVAQWCESFLGRLDRIAEEKRAETTTAARFTSLLKSLSEMPMDFGRKAASKAGGNHNGHNGGSRQDEDGPDDENARH